MSERHEDNDGSDIFWPGYVDATTNLILNLLFLVTILIVAVFMFALELGRSAPIEQTKSAIESSEQDFENAFSVEVEIPEAVSLAMVDFSEAVASAETAYSEATSLTEAEPSMDVSKAAHDLSEAVSTAADDLSDAVSMVAAISAEENIALKSEIERLNTLLANQALELELSGGQIDIVEATSILPKPQSGLDKTLTTEIEVKVSFLDEAIDFTSAERDRLLDSLQPFVARGKASIYVEVPTGFSESKRMGFYRAMAVRNLLIEMALPQESIDVLVIEGKHNANASLVRVM